MSDTVDLMVVGMSEALSAEELSERLVKEFKQPADAFDALVTAAIGAGPAYAAQSNVELAVALEGKEKLESLGVVCSIPGVDEQPAANQEHAEQTASELTAESDEPADEEASGADSDDAIELSDFADAEFDVSGSDEDDLMSSFDSESNDDDQQASDNATSESVVDISGDSEEIGFDFADELEALGADDVSCAPAVAAEESPDSAAEQLEFGDALDDLQALSDSVESDAAVVADAVQLDGEVTSLELDVDPVATDDSVIDDSSAVENKSVEPDISDIALSDDDNTPLTKPRMSSNTELDDGGLSLASDDQIAPIKAAATDVPEALANRSSNGAAEELSLSLDDSDSSASEVKKSATQSPLQKSDSVDLESAGELADLVVEPSVEVQSPADDAAVASELDDTRLPDDPDVAVDASIAEEPELDESAEQLNIGDLSDTAGTADLQQILDTIEQDAVPESIADEATDSAPDTLTAKPAESESPAAPADSDGASIEASQHSIAPSAAAESGKASAPKSIAEELIESLGGSDAAATPAPAAESVIPAAESAVFSGNDEQEQLRKSREQVAALQGKIDEDLEEEEQVYQEFEQIAKKRTVAKVAAGVATAAVVAAIGGGVFFSGILTPAPEPAVQIEAAAAQPQADREQESLNAAIERSATLINPENLTTEELLVTLAKGSAQDSLGDLRRYILGGSSRTTDNTDSDENKPRAGAAIPADSNSMKLLKNRVPHSGDKYFDEWSRREIDLRLYIELVDRLIDAGDIIAATELCNRTKDNLFAVMGKQSIARAYKREGNRAEALALLEKAARNTYSIASPAERVVAMADYAYSEYVIGQREDALDSYLSVSILAASLNRSEYKTIGHTAVSDYLMRAGLEAEARKQLDRSIGAALELPSNSAARDLALRHIALTEASMGLFEEAIKHTDQIIDPFASVSAYHGIALEYESNKDYAMATEVIQKAFDASSVIEDKEKRRQLLSKIQLANAD